MAVRSLRNVANDSYGLADSGKISAAAGSLQVARFAIPQSKCKLSSRGPDRRLDRPRVLAFPPCCGTQERLSWTYGKLLKPGLQWTPTQ
jgi:hypothetical protein